MKKNIFYLVIFVAIMLSSCKSVSVNNYKTTGQIPLPDPEVKFTITLTNENIETLGDIDILKEVTVTNKEYKIAVEQINTENFGSFFNTDFISATQISLLSVGKTSNESKIISSVIFDAITQYPDMDYILFPKYEITKRIDSGISDVFTQTISIRLRGKAVKIKM